MNQIIAVQPTVRQASSRDTTVLTEIIEASVRGLNKQNYNQQQLESALRFAFGVDPQLIADGTYYVAEVDGEIAGCGGWSRHRALYNGVKPSSNSASVANITNILDPATEAAKIRAFYVHPRWARRGIGRQLMRVCEVAARRAGFRRLELLATLTGEPLYTACGFHAVEPLDVMLPDGMTLRAIKMVKEL